ncbi:MAG: permease [Candidatus Saccharibacteria bacterium]|nr:permease [Candidatus Saccharibacteria bacterium]
MSHCAGFIVLPHASLQDFLTLMYSVIIEALPFVVLGVVIAVVVRLWLPPEFLLRRLPKQPLLRRATLSVLGVLLPVCECGNVPLARGLLARGLTPAEALTFLLAAPILNPVTIITTQQAFKDDSVVVWARIIGGFLIANVIGWLCTRLSKQQMLRADFIAACHESKSQQSRTGLWRAADVFRQEMTVMLPALVIGAIAAAAVQVLVPREVLLVLGDHPVWSVLAMTTLAFAVSICSSVDAFFALAFRHTFTPGSLVSFLTLGPMIDIKMLSLLRTTFRSRVLIEVSVLVALMAILLGLVVNYVG